MKAYLPASSLPTSLMVLCATFSLLFLSKTTWLETEKITRNVYYRYLEAKLELLDYQQLNEEEVCRQAQQQTVSYPLGNGYYRFHCERHSLFRKPTPTKEKFIAIGQIDDWFDLSPYADQIHTIRTLSELPASSEQDPQIVITLNEIDERLTQDFYGIIITEHYFNFTDKKIYGTIYSSHPNNDPNRRNLSFKRQVIEKLAQKHARWHYLPHSRNTLNDDDTP